MTRLKHAFCQSVGKFETPPLINEDAAIANDTKKFIAVSDGAGGGGVYADRWSKYLVDNLPSIAIKSFEELDQWIGSIWEPFYNECELLAKQVGGLLLDKFYDEGSSQPWWRCGSLLPINAYGLPMEIVSPFVIIL